MYKMVRKGDTSLQYTILPQTDQSTFSGHPQTSKKRRWRFVKILVCLLLLLFFIYKLVSDIGRLKAESTPGEVVRNRSRMLVATVSTTEERRIVLDLVDTVSSTQEVLSDEETEEVTSVVADVPPSTTLPPDPTSEASTKPQRVAQTTSSTPSTPTSNFDSLTTATPLVVPTIEPDVAKSSSSSPRKTKMPRVTLKLRGNESVPQMYMKAGIASYKKGNITTSVVAHKLSLEGLVFKTPEGTLKPWPENSENWFFTDPASDFQWKGSAPMPLTIYVVLAGLAGLAMISIILTLYVQRKASRRQRQSVEEPEVGGHEEDKSTLLGAEGQETEEKD